MSVAAFTETEHRLRDLNGVLELALMLACDRIPHDGDEPLMEELIGDAQQRLRETGRFPGRLSLFDADDIELLRRSIPSDTPLGHEIEFEFFHRGVVPAQVYGPSS